MEAFADERQAARRAEGWNRARWSARRTRPVDPTVGEYFDSILEHSSLRASTVAHYRGVWRAHLARRLGRRRLIEVSTADVRALMSQLRDSGATPSVLAACLRVLSRTFRAAVAEGLLERSPVSGVSTPAIQPRPDPVPLQQVRAIADAISPRYRAVVLAAAWTGLRMGEIGGLAPEDVDLEGRRLHVRRRGVD